MEHWWVGRKEFVECGQLLSVRLLHLRSNLLVLVEAYEDYEGWHPSNCDLNLWFWIMTNLADVAWTSRLLAGVHRIIKYFDFVSVSQEALEVLLSSKISESCNEAFSTTIDNLKWFQYCWISTFCHRLKISITLLEFRNVLQTVVLSLAESSIPVWNARLAIVVKEDAVKPGGWGQYGAIKAAKAQTHSSTRDVKRYREAPRTELRSKILRAQHTQVRQALLPGARNDLHLTSNSWSMLV